MHFCRLHVWNILNFVWNSLKKNQYKCLSMYSPQTERTEFLYMEKHLSPCSINPHFIPTLRDCTKAVFIGQICASVSKVTQIFQEKERLRGRVKEEAEWEGGCRIPWMQRGADPGSHGSPEDAPLPSICLIWSGVRGVAQWPKSEERSSVPAASDKHKRRLPLSFACCVLEKAGEPKCHHPRAKSAVWPACCSPAATNRFTQV